MAKIRITESELKKLVAERIKSVLKEADDAEIERRRDNFVQDKDAAYGKEYYGPRYSDRLGDIADYKGYDEMNYVLDRDRRAKHNASRNVKTTGPFAGTRKPVVSLSEGQLEKVVAESVKKALKEAYGTIVNDEGEPIGQEYIPSPYEQEISDAEEMDHRAQDSRYAVEQENQEWLRKAYAAFEAQGIEVPEDVARRLAQEMANKQNQETEDYEMERAKKCADFINSGNFGVKAKASYDPPTPQEYGQAYVTCYPRATKETRNLIIQQAMAQGLDYIEDYMDWSF